MNLTNTMLYSTEPNKLLKIFFNDYEAANDALKAKRSTIYYISDDQNILIRHVRINED